MYAIEQGGCTKLCNETLTLEEMSLAVLVSRACVRADAQATELHPRASGRSSYLMFHDLIRREGKELGVKKKSLHY